MGRLYVTNKRMFRFNVKELESNHLLKQLFNK